MVTGNFDCIQRFTVPELVLRAIERAMLGGRLKPGERLIETELADDMGVSRASIRQALTELERQGVVVREPRQGVYVNEWTAEHVLELATLRAVLEGHAAKLAAMHHDAQDIDALQKSLDQMQMALMEADVIAAADKDLEFHQAIWHASKHSLLVRVLQNFGLQIRMSMTGVGFLHMSNTERSQLFGDHAIILEAIRDRDPELAQQRLEEQLLTGAERWIRLHQEGSMSEVSVVSGA